MTHTDREKNFKGRNVEQFLSEGAFEVIYSNPVQSAGTASARPGYSEPSPAWPWQFAWMGETPSLWPRVFQVPHCKKVLFYVQPQSGHFKTITPFPVITYFTKKSLPISLTGLLYVLEGAERSPQSLLLSRLISPNSLSLYSNKMCPVPLIPLWPLDLL